eukprot:812223-Lingulodinium_polyedra.AAC.1
MNRRVKWSMRSSIHPNKPSACCNPTRANQASTSLTLARATSLAASSQASAWSVNRRALSPPQLVA